MDKGNKLYKKAKKIILGGNMLLSKRPEMILPDKWPTYYSKAKKTFIWDLEGNKYLDMVCLVGHNTLGYSNNLIDKEIIRHIKKGNMSSLNCPEEVQLSEILINMHKWAGMVKYARSGGEANTLAIRIARAASNKDEIAICGYHGWHDWYLSINLNNKNNLSKHLLPGLSAKGVSKNLKDSVHSFEYGNFNQLIRISKNKNLGIIIMEVARNSLPNLPFLKKVREICNKNNIILIFDECTTGFRNNLGGMHLKTKIIPDIVMYGKAIANGYALTAILGKKNIMKKAEHSFISSTFWGERSGFVAAIKTIEIMKKTKSWEKILKTGKYIIKEWKKIATKNNLRINIKGINSIISFDFIDLDNQKCKTFITQEMLKKKILATNIIYINTFHSKKLIDRYIKELSKIFNKIRFFEDNRISDFLETEIAHKNFKRLNE